MELIKLLPDYYDKNETMQLLQGILSAETDKTDRNLNQAVDQCFVASASIGLTRYENMLGLETDLMKSDRYRRERISAKSVGAGTTTKELVEHISQSFTNAETEVTEIAEEYTVIIRFTGTAGMPGNIADIKAAIEEAIPAHLKVIYEYIFNTYGSVGTFTYAELATYTHSQIRNGRLKNRIEQIDGFQHAELAQLTHENIAKGELPNGN